MKVGRQRRKIAKQDIYTPDAIQEEEIEPTLKEQTKQKKPKYTSKQVKERTKSKAKNQSESLNNDDSQQSEVLQFRHGDDAAKEHIRPVFLKRWDGVSNEVQLKREELDEMSPMMRVYWEVKSKNMNAVVFLQFGRMEFFAFENDAIKLHQMFKKRLKRFSKFIMVNFWYKQIQEVKKTLFESKVPILIMNQIEDAEYRANYGLIRREIVQVITPALHIDQQDQTPRERLLISLISIGAKFAVVILDAESNNCFAEQFDDDEQHHEIRRIFNKYRPVQLIIFKHQKRQIIQIAKQISNPYINQYQMRLPEMQKQLSQFQRDNSSPLFRQLLELYEKQRQSSRVFSKQGLVHALSLLQYYLSTLSLQEKVFNQGIFHSLTEKMNKKQHFFDSQVYQNLEVFRIKASQEETYAKPGTLMGFLDNCRTKHGRKLLHKWIDQPLSSLQGIRQRQKAIQQLFSSSNLLSYHDQLAKYERLEKRIGDIYHWVSRHYQRGKLILTRYINPEKQYDLKKNPAVNKLKELISILQQIKDYERLLSKMSSSQIESSLLKKNMSLIQSEDIHTLSVDEMSKLQGIPKIGYIADSILRRVYYDQMTGHIEPRPGQSQIFDYEKKEVERINISLESQLDKWKEYFKTQKIIFASVRAKNEIQIPKMAISKCPPNKQLIFSSQIANCIRYTTHETNILSEEIMEHQRAIAQSYEAFLQKLIQHFCSYKYQWNVYIRSMATLDVLMAISKAAQNMPIKSLPEFKVNGGLTIKNGYNVNLIGLRQNLVSNSVNMDENERVLLLTGPNMGGKSTFLKQVCYLAILAQIGSYVPAEHYSSIIFDQIFCRMGASDRIYEGKSTFYVELQQTKRAISKATSSSLVVIDQLGRGTSTFDGMAISQSILDHLISTIKCITLYSTHYTQITQQYQKNSLVRLMKMGYEPTQQGINFTYQLIPGVAQKSFATNVARLVNIPQQIIMRAEARSQIMHQQIIKKKQLRQIFRLCGDMLTKSSLLNESTSCSR